MSNEYDTLLENYQEIQLLNSISGVLYWDMNTHMPPAAVGYRAKQFQYISQKIHGLTTKPEVGTLLETCEKDNSLDDFRRRNIELIRRAYDDRTILPSELVGKLAAQSNKTLEVWKKAKAKSDFQMVLPDLEDLFALNVESTTLLAKSKNMDDPFNALIDSRDKGFSVKLLTNLFDEVKSFLIPFIKKCSESEVKPDRSFLSRNVSRSTQVKMVENLARFLEYDFYSDNAVGNIAEVEHPLTIGGGFKDVRVTVKYHEDHVLSAFLAGAHECGHAIHGLQGKDEWFNQPIYRMSSPSFGESQSRFLENVITSSKEFWNYYYPQFQKDTADVFKNISLEDFYFALNAVNPGFIRIQADEVTYILHIIIRFEIERDWFAGKIDTKELPQVWNEKYKHYLGVDVPSDTLGLMQDLHWYSQYYGYFFGYGIGDLISSQITAKMSQDLPDWKTSLQNGKFTPIRQWLELNIHQRGGTLDCLDMVKSITGEDLTPRYHIEYLKEKFSPLYQI
ncbi:MAG: carboxypeptidase M32 [Candidatus Heimdallarchaeota archaeon]|nr:carboxypeptidase M32 [Candidatus Heimdallarchaeota archaeon]MCG3255016.1 carboxypeptidase M32 [Candidatus Heimdallarchaeota archaeon]MCK4610090.1 carboxypeptidase M32 [Candidatus Heimdallarchaeota archaeon]